MKLKVKDLIEDGVEVYDIPTMYEMSDGDYIKFIQNEGVFYLDHHGILRCGISGRPLATTLEQIDILLEELGKCRAMMQPKK